MNIFENEQFNGIMYVAISLVTLLIFFNFVSIIENKENVIFRDKNILTGFVVSEINESNDIYKLEGELYSERSYLIYYTIISLLGFFLMILSFRYLLPYIKKYS